MTNVVINNEHFWLFMDEEKGKKLPNFFGHLRLADLAGKFRLA